MTKPIMNNVQYDNTLNVPTYNPIPTPINSLGASQGLNLLSDSKAFYASQGATSSITSSYNEFIVKEMRGCRQSLREYILFLINYEKTH